jgi:hypothetical protein
VSVEELAETARSLARGAAPGINGITGELVRLLMEDKTCALALAELCSKITSNNLPDDIRTRLTRSRLIGIPKPDGGIRPIAVGDTMMKLSSIVVMNRLQQKLYKYFDNLQFGIGVKGGAEIVAHRVRDNFSAGASVLTVDFSNAFNSPQRSAIATELYSRPELEQLWHLFQFEYDKPSELVVFRNGKLLETITSTRGTRQGTVLGGLFFCIAIQPALRQLRKEFPNVDLYAYMDDVTLTGATERLSSAFARLLELVKPLGLLPNMRKCEFLKNPLCAQEAPTALIEQGVTLKTEGIIKVLGTYTGDSTEATKAVSLKIRASDILFERLKTLPNGPCKLAILQKCAVPKPNFLFRTHTPEVARQAAEHFESRCHEALRDLLMAELSTEERQVASLPMRMGGVGVTDVTKILQDAYESSKGLAMISDDNTQSVRAQKEGTEIYFCDLVKTLSEDRVRAKRLLDAGKKFASLWMTMPGMKWAGDLFSGALRYRLGITRGGTRRHCEGCRKTFSAADFLDHAPGCASRSGFNTTQKHNSLRDYLVAVMLEAGIVTRAEPRDWETYKCKHCAQTVTDRAEHRLVCAGSLVRSGPDIEAFLQMDHAGPTRHLYDVSVVHSTAPSHLARSVTALFKERQDTKDRSYGARAAQEGAILVPLVCTSHGAIDGNLIKLFDVIALKSVRTRDELIAGFQTTLHIGNGAAIAVLH